MIDPSVAIKLPHKVSSKVAKDDVLIRIYYNSEPRFRESLAYVEKCWEVSERAGKRKLILDTVY